MSRVVRNIRHQDIVGRIALRSPKSLNRTIADVNAQVDRINVSTANTSDALDALAHTLSIAAERRLDAAHEAEKGQSAITGYIRDAAGKRLRPMTPSDLQALADAHYGRKR